MKRRHALQIAVVAVLGALAIAALPALAGARDDHHRGGHDGSGERHHHGRGEQRGSVGRITAFDPASGQLTIARFGGGTITGLVTGSTEIRCEGRAEGAMSSRDHGGNSGPSSESGDDHGGQGEEEPGDDHGEGVEPGDDNGGQGEEEPGDDHGGQGDNGARVCTTADLTVGNVVHAADREFENGVATFDEIELAHAG